MVDYLRKQENTDNKPAEKNPTDTQENWRAWQFCLPQSVEIHRTQEIEPISPEVNLQKTGKPAQKSSNTILLQKITASPNPVTPGNLLTITAHYTLTGAEKMEHSWSEQGRLRLINKNRKIQEEIVLPETIVHGTSGNYHTKIQMQIPENHQENLHSFWGEENELVYLFRILINGKQYEQSVLFSIKSKLENSGEQANTPLSALSQKTTPSPITEEQTRRKAPTLLKTKPSKTMTSPKQLQVTVRTASIREDASLQAKIIGKAQKDQKLTVNAQKTVDGQTWYGITFTQNGQEIRGWIFSSTVKSISNETHPSNP